MLPVITLVGLLVCLMVFLFASSVVRLSHISETAYQFFLIFRTKFGDYKVEKWQDTMFENNNDNNNDTLKFV